MATPKGTPLDAERARLRALGHTEVEISQILINRESGGGSQQPAGAAPVQGTMTGVLGNASAALSHARGAILGIRGDINNLFDVSKTRLDRAISGGFLAFKAAIIVVLGYAIYQEWQQHIISATARAAADAATAQAESRVAQETAQQKIEQAKWETAKARAAYGTAIGHYQPEDQAIIAENVKAEAEREKAKPPPTCPPGQKYVGPPSLLRPGCYQIAPP